MSAKIFTLEEARRTLPLVRRIVADVVAAYTTWCEVEHQRRNETSPVRRQELEDREFEIRHRILELDGEVAAIGAVSKGIDEGLIDWYGEMDGRIVYFCWRQGEDDIEWYHELEAGFAGRCRLPVRAET